MFRINVCAVSFFLVSHVLSQQYELVQTYTTENFFDEFRFFTGQDPTSGFVQYAGFESAVTSGLISNASDAVYLGVDHTNVYTAGGPGRPSVRLESISTFTEGLFVLNLTHMPVGCGVWPAFWTVGLGDWPADGEIDIIENVNDATVNNAALHAAGECAVDAAVDQTGTWKSTDCTIAHDENQGCGSKFTEPYSYGSTFNQNGGGIYAMEWTNSTINIWFFPPAAVPESLAVDSLYAPDPSTFGTPSTSFAGPCSSSFGEKFFNHTLIIDTTFCGGWAGGSFGSADSLCPKAEGLSPQENCINFVANNPTAFEEAYWSLDNLRVWQKAPTFRTISAINHTEHESTPITPSSVEEVEVSPLTGGVLHSNDKAPFPIPIDPGIGDGTLPVSVEPDVGAFSTPVSPDVWNTEGSVESPPTHSIPVLEAPAVGSVGLTEGIPIPVDPTTGAGTEITQELPEADIWDALDGYAQSQILALANALSMGTPSGTTLPYAPTLDRQEASQTANILLSLLDDSTKNQLLSLLDTSASGNAGTSRQDIAPGGLDAPVNAPSVAGGGFANPPQAAPPIEEHSTISDSIWFVPATSDLSASSTVAAPISSPAFELPVASNLPEPLSAAGAEFALPPALPVPVPNEPAIADNVAPLPSAQDPSAANKAFLPSEGEPLAVTGGEFAFPPALPIAGLEEPVVPAEPSSNAAASYPPVIANEPPLAIVSDPLTVAGGDAELPQAPPVPSFDVPVVSDIPVSAPGVTDLPTVAVGPTLSVLADPLAAAGGGFVPPLASIPGVPDVPVEPTLPISSEVPSLPAVDAQDTSQAAGTLFSALDDATKNQLLSFLAPMIQAAPLSDPTLSADNVADTQPAPIAEPAIDTVTASNTPQPAEPATNTVTGSQPAPIFNTSADTSQAAGPGRSADTQEEGAVNSCADPSNLQRTKAPIGSRLWIRNFITDLILFNSIYDSLSSHGKAEIVSILAKVAQEIESSVLTGKRSIPTSPTEDAGIEAAMLAGLTKRQGKWNFHSSHHGFKPHGGWKPRPGDPIEPLTSNSAKQSSAGIASALPDSSADGVDDLNGEIGNMNDLPDSSVTASTSFTTQRGIPLTWDYIFNALTPGDIEKLEKFLELFETFEGTKPDPQDAYAPYLEYIAGWQSTWSTFDDDTRALVLALLGTGVLPAAPDSMLGRTNGVAAGGGSEKGSYSHPPPPPPSQRLDPDPVPWLPEEQLNDYTDIHADETTTIYEELAENPDDHHQLLNPSPFHTNNDPSKTLKLYNLLQVMNALNPNAKNAIVSVLGSESPQPGPTKRQLVIPYIQFGADGFPIDKSTDGDYAAHALELVSTQADADADADTEAEEMQDSEDDDTDEEQFSITDDLDDTRDTFGDIIDTLFAPADIPIEEEYGPVSKTRAWKLKRDEQSSDTRVKDVKHSDEELALFRRSDIGALLADALDNILTTLKSLEEYGPSEDGGAEALDDAGVHVGLGQVLQDALDNKIGRVHGVEEEEDEDEEVDEYEYAAASQNSKTSAKIRRRQDSEYEALGTEEDEYAEEALDDVDSVVDEYFGGVGEVPAHADENAGALDTEIDDGAEPAVDEAQDVLEGNTHSPDKAEAGAVKAGSAGGLHGFEWPTPSPTAAVSVPAPEEAEGTEAGVEESEEGEEVEEVEEVEESETPDGIGDAFGDEPELSEINGPATGEMVEDEW